MPLDENPYRSPPEPGEPVSTEADTEAPGEKSETALSLGAVIGGLAGLVGGCVVAVIVILKTWLPAIGYAKGPDYRFAPFLIFFLLLPFLLLILVTFMGIFVGGVVETAKALISRLRRATRGH